MVAADNHHGDQHRNNPRPGSVHRRQRNDRERPMHQQQQQEAHRHQRVQRRRRSQLLYRDRQNMQELNLVLDVNELRAQVAQLERMASLYETQRIHAQIRWDQELVGRVERYFHLFYHGLIEPSGSPGRQALGERQREFIRWFMGTPTPFPCNDGLLDADRCLALWNQAMVRYPGMRLQLATHRVIHVDANRVVEATVHVQSQISRATVAELFPCALGYETLVQSLLREHMEMSLRNQFFFDANGRLVRYLKTVEMSPSLLSLVHRIQLMCLHLGASHEAETPHFMIEPASAAEPEPRSAEEHGHNQALAYQIRRETSDSSPNTTDTWSSATTSHEAEMEELKEHEEQEEKEVEPPLPSSRLRQRSKHDIRFVLS